jgi:uncharacterized DUF497 family protein
MRLEFDSSKSAENLAKHGIDFVVGQELWEDADRLETPARSADESRFQVVGTIGGRLWSAFITYRHDTIRLISIRRARPEEDRRYRDEETPDGPRSRPSPRSRR